jgi:hypothetical protein
MGVCSERPSGRITIGRNISTVVATKNLHEITRRHSNFTIFEVKVVRISGVDDSTNSSGKDSTWSRRSPARTPGALLWQTQWRPSPSRRFGTDTSRFSKTLRETLDILMLDRLWIDVCTCSISPSVNAYRSICTESSHSPVKKSPSLRMILDSWSRTGRMWCTARWAKTRVGKLPMVEFYRRPCRIGKNNDDTMRGSRGHISH